MNLTQTRLKISKAMNEASGLNEEGIPNKYLAFVNALDGGEKMYPWFRARPRAPEFEDYFREST